ncbi:MAG: response regulator [Candidatus Tectomicrobia bacterium]|nr:response regulator [Candidatus Tectomicrobia bacterium]
MTGNLLIIEDEPRLRNNLKLLLTSEGYTVATAADGQEGIDHLKQEPFDLVITDIMMGDVNGFQIMEHITAHTPDTLIIVITGYASTESAVEALRQGAYDYITKPFEIEIIQISIARALEKVQLKREISHYMDELEQRVVDRTVKLQETNKKLHASLSELKSTQEQLIQTEKLSALGELISGFAHELNNPLTSVLGYSEMAAMSSECPDDIRSMLDMTCQEARRCHQIVNNLLSFARKRKPEKQSLDLNEVCRKTLHLLSYQFQVNNVTTVVQLDETLPQTMADEPQLQQVLVNIMSNAYQAMAVHQNGGELTVTTAHEDTVITISVTDTGPGIAPEHVQRIFDPFFTTKQSGTGLGMSLSYGLIKEHGGELTATSPPGEGATFTMTLPIVSEPLLATNPPPISEDFTVSPQRILVIDDEESLLRLLMMSLNALGHETEATISSREALHKIDTQTYDLIICDMKMPEVDGYQVYRFVEEHHPDMLSRMIFSSGDTVSEEFQAFFQETGCRLLQKPFLQNELQQAIYQVIASSVA